MKTINYKVYLVPALLVIAGAFAFSYRMYDKDIKKLESFLRSYERSDQAISDLSISVFALLFKDSSTAGRLDRIYARLYMSNRDGVISNRDRLVAAKEAMRLHHSLLAQLQVADVLEHKVIDALNNLRNEGIILSGLSSFIRNDGELRTTALEILDFSKDEVEHLSGYKKTIRDRIETMGNLSQEIIDHNGKRESFEASIQPNYRAWIKGKNSQLDGFYREFRELDDNRNVAFARFQQFGGRDPASHSHKADQ